MEAFGGDPDALAATALRPGEAFAYLEVHIEQGPYLESVDAPVGVVTAISGQSRILTAFTGEAGHAGTVAMHLRRDPLPAAAEIVLAAENLARHTSGLLATVGTIEVTPGASNVIPGQVRFSMDIRHPEDAVRTDAVSVLERRVREVAATRSLGSIGASHGITPPSPVTSRSRPGWQRQSRPRACRSSGSLRRWARRRGDVRGRAGRHALRPLRRRYQPSPGGVGDDGRRRRRDRRARSVP